MDDKTITSLAVGCAFAAALGLASCEREGRRRR